MARAVADGRRPANVGASDYAAVERMRRVFRAPHAELQEVRRIIAGVSGGSTPINAGPCPADLVDLTFQVEVASNQRRKEPLVGRIWKLARLLEPAGGSRLEATVLLPWRRIPSITTWALLGDYRLDGPQGCGVQPPDAPVQGGDQRSRSGHVVGRPSRRRIGRVHLGPLDERLGVTSWRASLAQNLTLTGRGLEHYRRVRNGWEESPEIPDAVIGVLTQVAEDQRLAARTLLRDASAFVDPFQNTRIPRADLPPDVRFAFRGFGIQTGVLRTGRTIERRDRYGKP
jgi:hypothetical protein